MMPRAIHAFSCVEHEALQHVELLFALSVKVPEFLDEYGHARILSLFLY